MSPSQRAIGLGRRAFLATSTAALGTVALGRTPSGGVLRLSVPWPLGALDPHAIDEASGALFAAAVAEPLFGLDPRGRPYPTLAARMPEHTPRGARVTLRPLLLSGRGRPLDARDIIFSWKRARDRAAAGILGPFGEPFPDPADALAVVVPGADSEMLARALATPVTALVPRGFTAQRPDGAGPFTASPGPERLRLTRNPVAARGPAFLDAVEVSRAADLADALRAFEAGEVDVGWLGRGLHRPRAGAVDFTGPLLGWAVLRTGPRAGAWGAPGVAQRMLDGVAPERLEHLGLGSVPATQGASPWGGPPAEILVRADAPHLVKIASTMAAILGQPGHELTTSPRPEPEFARRRRAGDFTLLVDFVRSIGAEARHPELALLASTDLIMARRPPRTAAGNVRVLARTLAVGVIGELRLRAAETGRFRAVPGWDLGLVSLPR